MNLVNGLELQKHLSHLSALQKLRIMRGAKVRVAEEQREGWSGKLPFYVFWCDQCENFSYDYPHGYIDRRYLKCHACEARIDFVPWWVEWQKLWYAVKFVMSSPRRK